MPYCYKHVSEDNPRGVYYDVQCPVCAKKPKYTERKVQRTSPRTQVQYRRVNYASLKPEHIKPRTLIVATSRGSYPWLNSEVAQVIVDESQSLAPSEELHNDFQNAKQKYLDEGLSKGMAHGKAWIDTNYEARYLAEIEENGLPEFDDYDEVIFSCWCATNSPCHTDLLVDKYSNDGSQQLTLFQIDEEKEEQLHPWANKEYKPLTVDSILLSDLPVWWKRNGRNSDDADPENGVPVPGYIKYPKGTCQNCGKKLYKKRGRSQRGKTTKYCKDCAPKVNKQKQAIRNFRQTIVRRLVGEVPVDTLPFYNYVQYFNVGVSAHDRLGLKCHDFSEADKTVHRNLPKGVEPERVEPVTCTECGTKPVIYKGILDVYKDAENYYNGNKKNRVGKRYEMWGFKAIGKIGANILVCPDCGTVISNCGLKSYDVLPNTGYLGQ